MATIISRALQALRKPADEAEEPAAEAPIPGMQRATPEEQWWQIIKYLMDKGYEDIAIRAEVIRG